MSLVCDSLNMCKDREIFITDDGAFAKTPNFCPFCGRKWFVSAINEIAFQPYIEDRQTERCGCIGIRSFTGGVCSKCGKEMPIYPPAGD